MKGRPQDALPEIERVGYDPMRTFLHAIAYHALGRKKESDAALRELIEKYQAINPYLIAEIYAFQNQPDEAFKWLDRAYAEHDDSLIQTGIEPPAEELAQRPSISRALEEAQFADPINPRPQRVEDVNGGRCALGIQR